MRARASVAVVVVSSVLALAGCGSDPEPKVPDESPSSAASASPAPAEPTLPPAAVEDSKEGAIAFVEHYIELLNYAANTGDVAALQAASADDCEGCKSYIDSFLSIYESGGDVEGFAWVIKRSEALRTTLLATEIESAQYRVKKSGESGWARVESNEYQISLELEREGNTWRVHEMTRPKEAA